MGMAARNSLDPTREYRRARQLVDDAPTVGNQMRLAQAAVGLGKHDEAEKLFGAALTGIHADDPTLLLGRANALIELGRFGEALPLLDKLGQDPDKGRTPPVALALGRTYEGLGRMTEADTALQWASSRIPGLEGLARYAAFLAHVGRKAEAREVIDEMDKARQKRQRPVPRRSPRLARPGGPGADVVSPPSPSWGGTAECSEAGWGSQKPPQRQQVSRLPAAVLPT